MKAIAKIITVAYFVHRQSHVVRSGTLGRAESCFKLNTQTVTGGNCFSTKAVIWELGTVPRVHHTQDGSPGIQGRHKPSLGYTYRLLLHGLMYRSAILFSKTIKLIYTAEAPISQNQGSGFKRPSPSFLHSADRESCTGICRQAGCCPYTTCTNLFRTSNHDPTDLHIKQWGM